MKKVIAVSCFLVGMASVCLAAPPVSEAPISGVGTPVTVSIDASTLTKIPTSQMSGRIGVYVDAPASNSGKMVGFFGNCTSTALANTIRPIEIAPGTNSSYYPMREDVCLWLITTNATAENIHYQEVKQ
jgi:hypothetical protein